MEESAWHGMHGGEAAVVQGTASPASSHLHARAPGCVLSQGPRPKGGKKETAWHGMALVSPGGKLITANSAFCNILDVSSINIKRYRLQNLVSETSRPALLNNIGRMLAGENSSVQLELGYSYNTVTLLQ